MAADYVTLQAFKGALGITGGDRDADFALCITAASRAVDRLTRRPDGDFAAQALVRYFDAPRGDHLWVPSLLSVTTLKTDGDGDGTFETTWSVAGGNRDYILAPYQGPPYRRIEVDRTSGRYSFPGGQRTVEIAGSWGEFATVPKDVERATILLANRLASRPKTPEAVYGSLEGGFTRITKEDPDVRALLAPYFNVQALFA